MRNEPYTYLVTLEQFDSIVFGRVRLKAINKSERSIVTSVLVVGPGAMTKVSSWRDSLGGNSAGDGN